MVSAEGTAASPRAKTARLEARVTPEQKALLQRAADLSGQSLTDFVVAAAQDAARRTVETPEVIRLSAEDSKRFVELLLNPPAPNEALREAAEAYKETVVDEGL